MTRTLRTGRFVVVPAPPMTLCLAFANTLTWRGSEAPSESLVDLDALLAWSEREIGFPAAAMSDLRGWAGASPAEAAQLFAAAIALRETIFGVFASVAGGGTPSDIGFEALRGAVDKGQQRRSLAREKDAYGWRMLAPLDAIRLIADAALDGEPDASDPWQTAAAALLAPVIWSAADLLLDAGHLRIRQCANEKCLWLFVDASKSGTRRWCDMGACGNRAKAQRHYAKVRRA